MSKPTWKLLVKDDGTVAQWDMGQWYVENYGYKYIDNFEWVDTLKYETFDRGNSAAHLFFKSVITGKSYQMFLKDFENIVKLLVNGQVSGKWTYYNLGPDTWTVRMSSIAWPKLGCSNGGLKWEDVKPLMIKYLEPLPIKCEIYE